MTVDIDGRPEPIATGRTWRDIPPQPPTEAPASTLPSVEPAASEGPGWRRWRVAAIIGLLALAFGVAVGVWAPWQDEPATDVSTGRQQANAANPEPESTTTLPPRIIPPPAEDPLVPESVFPEEFFRFEGFPDLSELFGEDFARPPDSDAAGPEAPDLIVLNELPEGYQLAGTSLASSPGILTEQLTLRGPAGPAIVRAERRGGAALPAGSSYQVGDVAGVLVEGDPTAFSWAAGNDVVVTIEVPESAAPELLESLVPSVEVVQ